MSKRKKPKDVLFCGACGVTYSLRRKACSCGNENLGETTQPASLECGHCGDAAIESTSGLFSDDQGGNCAACGMRGQVRVDEDRAYWSVADDDDANVCNRAECDECREWRASHPALRAKFYGQCNRCVSPINPGDRIVRHNLGWAHANENDCANANDGALDQEDPPLV